MDNLSHLLDERFDPTDADNASKVAHAALKLMKAAERAVWAYNHTIGVGRDDATEMSVRIGELAVILNLLPHGYNSKDRHNLSKSLTGLE